MPKGTPSATEAPPLPVQEVAPSEVSEETQVEAAPVAEETPAPQVQEEAKPDYVAQLRELPDEERERLLNEVYADRLQALDRSAEDRAYNRLLGSQQRQQRANEDLQGTLRNLDNESDDTKRAQHVAAFAQGYANQVVQEQAQEWRSYFDTAFKRSFGLNDGQYRAAWIEVHKKAALENRKAEDADFIAHMTGEKFMPKQSMSKELNDEINARVEEAVGKRLAGQPAPVALGPSEPPGGEVDVAKAQGQEGKRAAFEKKWGFKPLT